MRIEVTRGKVAGAFRPLDHETCAGSVDRWTSEVWKSMFHLRKGRSGPVSGTGSMSGFSLTSALTTRTRKGSRTGPSLFFGLAGEKRWKKRRTVITSHKWVHTVTNVCFCTVEGTMHRRGLPVCCGWWWCTTHSLMYPP